MRYGLPMATPIPSPATDPGTLMKRAALAAIATAVFLATIKFAAWWWTGSVAMLASFADSGLDLAASTLNALAIRYALTPADAEHRFGHGRAEAVAGLAQAALVGGSALFLIVQSVRRLFAPQPLAYETAGLAVAAISIVATVALVAYQGYVVRRSGSLAVSADRLHYVTDLASNGAVFAALLLTGLFGALWADGAFGLVIALIIGGSAFTILRRSFDQLVDRELPDADRERIQRAASAVPGVLDVHDLRTRQSGARIFVQLHAVFDGALSLEDAHALADKVEAAVMDAVPNAEVLVHADPSAVLAGGEGP